MITASGGIVYHARAARGLIKLLNPLGSWNPTRRHVSSWVRGWVELHKFKTLILVGPSAAYLINENLWSEIEQLIVVEPDRLARWIFNQRFSVSHLKWFERRDLLPYFSAQPGEFDSFLKNYDPQTTGILFFGCLGQMSFHEKNFSRPEAEARKLILKSLRRFESASLHDLASVTVPEITPSAQRLLAEQDLSLNEKSYDSRSLAELMRGFSNHLVEASAKGVHLRQTPLVWTDHDTYWLGRPKSVCPWLLTAKQIHLLGFVELPRTAIGDTD